MTDDKVVSTPLQGHNYGVYTMVLNTWSADHSLVVHEQMLLSLFCKDAYTQTDQF